jgi:hypothetical protein
MIQNLFLEHPEERNMTYLEHMKHAWFLGWNLMKGSIALFIHGLVPKYFPDTGSLVIKDMYKIVTNIPSVESEEIHEKLA